MILLSLVSARLLEQWRPLADPPLSVRALRLCDPSSRCYSTGELVTRHRVAARVAACRVRRLARRRGRVRGHPFLALLLKRCGLSLTMGFRHAATFQPVIISRSRTTTSTRPRDSSRPVARCAAPVWRARGDYAHPAPSRKLVLAPLCRCRDFSGSFALAPGPGGGDFSSTFRMSSHRWAKGPRPIERFSRLRASSPRSTGCGRFTAAPPFVRCGGTSRMRVNASLAQPSAKLAGSRARNRSSLAEPERSG